MRLYLARDVPVTDQIECELTVVDVEERLTSTAEERALLHIHVTVLALLLVNHLLHSRPALIHQIPAADAAVQPRVDLIHIHTNNDKQNTITRTTATSTPQDLSGTCPSHISPQKS